MLNQIRLPAVSRPGSRAFLLLLIALLALFSWRSVLAQELQCAAPQNEDWGAAGTSAGYFQSDVGYFESKLPASFAEGLGRGKRGIDLWTDGLLRDARWGLRNGRSKYPEQADGQERGPRNRATPAKPASESNSAIKDTGICPTGSMVIIATGEKLLSQVDATSGGLYGMTLARTYRSATAAGRLFGAHWSSSLDPSSVTKSTLPCINTEVGCIPRDATVTFPDGAKYKYTWMPTSPGEYQVNGAAAMGTLSGGVTPSSGWWLSIGTRSYTFNSTGTQLGVTDPDGVSISYAWSSTGTSTVTNKVGKTMTFTRGANGLVNQVTDLANRTWSYAYNANGMLATVTSPGASPDVRSYHYPESVTSAR